jgi:hypothetical protein
MIQNRSSHSQMVLPMGYQKDVVYLSTFDSSRTNEICFDMASKKSIGESDASFDDFYYLELEKHEANSQKITQSGDNLVTKSGKENFLRPSELRMRSPDRKRANNEAEANNVLMRRRRSPYFIEEESSPNIYQDNSPIKAYRGSITALIKGTKFWLMSAKHNINVNETVNIGIFPSYRAAKLACWGLSPPLWSIYSDRTECYICSWKPRISKRLFYGLHHCRNCGYFVCNQCSSKSWPSSMIPASFHYSETFVRVCDCCFELANIFVKALREGNLKRAICAFSTGNVNIYCPYSVYKTEEYALHSAAIGGNVILVKWLLEGRQCSLFDNKTGEMLKTSDGHTPLSLAEKYNHIQLVHYFKEVLQSSSYPFDRLITEEKFQESEISFTTPRLRCKEQQSVSSPSKLELCSSAVTNRPLRSIALSLVHKAIIDAESYVDCRQSKYASSINLKSQFSNESRVEESFDKRQEILHENSIESRYNIDKES